MGLFDSHQRARRHTQGRHVSGTRRRVDLGLSGRAGVDVVIAQLHRGRAALHRRTPLDFLITGRAGVATSGVSAVLLNLTATQPTASGYPVNSGELTPTSASSVKFLTGQTTSNLVVAPVRSDGTVVIAMEGGALGPTVQVVGAAV